MDEDNHHVCTVYFWKEQSYSIKLVYDFLSKINIWADMT